MKSLTVIVSMLLLQAATPKAPPLVSIPAQADKEHQQTQAMEERTLAQETHAHDYWVDLSPGLMWSAMDNGKDITWGKATKYCSNPLASVGLIPVRCAGSSPNDHRRHCFFISSFSR